MKNVKWIRLLIIAAVGCVCVAAAGLFLFFGLGCPGNNFSKQPERLSYDPEEHKAFFDTEWVAFSGQKDRRVWVSGSAVDVVAKKLLRLRSTECFRIPGKEMFPFAVRFTSADGKMTEVLLNAQHFSFDGWSDRKKCFSHDITGEELEAFYVTVEAANRKERERQEVRPRASSGPLDEEMSSFLKRYWGLQRDGKWDEMLDLFSDGAYLIASFRGRTDVLLYKAGIEEYLRKQLDNDGPESLKLSAEAVLHLMKIDSTERTKNWGRIDYHYTVRGAGTYRGTMVLDIRNDRMRISSLETTGPEEEPR